MYLPCSLTHAFHFSENNFLMISWLCQIHTLLFIMFSWKPCFPLTLNWTHRSHMVLMPRVFTLTYILSCVIYDFFINKPWFQYNWRRCWCNIKCLINICLIELNIYIYLFILYLIQHNPNILLLELNILKITLMLCLIVGSVTHKFSQLQCLFVQMSIIISLVYYL